MLNLDLRTIIFMSGILAALLSLVMLLLRLSYPRTLKGLGYWILAPLFVSVSTFLFSLRGQIPDVVSIVGANMMLIAGILLIHFGSQLFFGVQPAYRLWYTLLCAMLPVLIWFSMYQPSFNARVQLVCVLWISILLANARVVWRNGVENFATRFTVVAMVTHAMVIGLRLLATLLPLPDEGLLTPTRVQTLYIAANALMIIAITVGLVMLVAERLRSEFEHLATRDSLTGALTRRVLIAACEHELARCRRHGRSMALLVMDIDHFKSVNDTHGHQMGDRVLVDVVNRVSALLRRPDLLARFGGEEFVVLLHDTGLDEAQAVAKRIQARIAEPVPGLPPVTVSIGVTVNRPDEEQVDTLLARADRALYEAKEGGRNRVVVIRG